MYRPWVETGRLREVHPLVGLRLRRFGGSTSGQGNFAWCTTNCASMMRAVSRSLSYHRRRRGDHSSQRRLRRNRPGRPGRESEDAGVFRFPG